MSGDAFDDCGMVAAAYNSPNLRQRQQRFIGHAEHRFMPHKNDAAVACLTHDGENSDSVFLGLLLEYLPAGTHCTEACHLIVALR